MPVLVIYQSDSVTADSYAPYEADIMSGPLPSGALIHQVALGEGGGYVVDLWESREAYETFARNRINPTLVKHGLAVEPPIVLDAAVLATDGIDAYKALNPLRAS